jgi:hypothetical protein
MLHIGERRDDRRMPVLAFRTITNAAYAMDGGSITLWLRDEHEGEHELLLVQHRMPARRPDRRPGRLYLDGRLIDVRSPEEATILGFLEVAPTSVAELSGRKPTERIAFAGADLEAFFAAVEKGPAATVRHLAKEVVAFVRSDEYLGLAASTSGA